MNKKVSAGIFLLGVTLGVGGSKLAGSADAASTHEVFQNTHIWVASQSKDGGSPAYGARSCTWLYGPDAGKVGEAPCTEGTLSEPQVKCFESYLSCVGK